MKTRRSSAVALLTGFRQACFLGVLCFTATCKPAEDTAREAARIQEAPSPPPVRATFPVEECVCAETADPAEGVVLSVYSKHLMHALGTGILEQEEGSLCRIACPDGTAFFGWIDFDGSFVSVLYGTPWAQRPAFFSPERIPELRLGEMRDGQWWEISGAFQSVTTPLVPGSGVSTGTYVEYSNASISPYSKQLLKHFGIATKGQESRVRVKLGDNLGTGFVGPDGELRIVNRHSWVPEELE